MPAFDLIVHGLRAHVLDWRKTSTCRHLFVSNPVSNAHFLIPSPRFNLDGSASYSTIFDVGINYHKPVPVLQFILAWYSHHFIQRHGNQGQPSEFLSYRLFPIVGSNFFLNRTIVTVSGFLAFFDCSKKYCGSRHFWIIQ
jgi:hypothetical protein